MLTDIFTQDILLSRRNVGTRKHCILHELTITPRSLAVAPKSALYKQQKYLFLTCNLAVCKALQFNCGVPLVLSCECWFPQATEHGAGAGWVSCECAASANQVKSWLLIKDCHQVLFLLHVE